MPVTVERLPGERILIATLIGDITIEDVIEMYQQSNALIAGEEGVFHRITDTRQATSSFPEMLKKPFEKLGMSQAPEHEPNHGRINHASTRTEMVFIILAQPSVVE